MARSLTSALVVASLCSCATLAGRPPTGADREVSGEATAAMRAIGELVRAKIVWSSSRIGNHDVFMMNADGTDLVALSQGTTVDWFPRFSPDGERILFVRSKKGWVSERDANRTDKWDQVIMAADGANPTVAAENASWGNWLSNTEIVFVRGQKIMIKDLESGKESVYLDSDTVPDLEGLLLQQPQLTADRNYMGLTLRGGRRGTGIWNNVEKSWLETGKGCQVNWFPDQSGIYWVNPSGNGGSEVFAMQMQDGKPIKEYDHEELRFMDIPGRRSHEYFPQISKDGNWMVWAATQRGHDHDIADYEIYIWKVGAPPEQATRLTFHSGNDRWPDIHILPSSD